MKLITKRNFLPIVCIGFTALVCGKLLMEKLMGVTDRYYTENIFTCLGFCVLIPAVLALHYRLQRFPLIPVLIGQYAVAVAAVVVYTVTVAGHTIHDTRAIFEMVRSVTIPYAAGAVIYYAAFFLQVRKANRTLTEINAELSTGL